MNITTVRGVARAILPVLLAAIGLTGIGRAQAITGTIIGTITDATGAVIPGAAVSITNKENGASNQRTADASGQYTAPFLQPAHYRVQVEAPGFNAVANDDVVVQVDQTVRVDVRLEVGQMSNVVNVTAAPPLVESDSSALGEVVERQQIVSLPLNGRLFSQLVALTPGAVQRGFGDFGEDPAAAGARAPVNATVNGLPWSGNNYLIDGVANNEPLNSYVATRGSHLFRDIDIDTPLPGPGDINARRPFYALNPNITSIHDRRSDGMSYYNALQAKLSKRFSSGLQALVSYTYSKTIDDVSQILDPYNDALNRALSSGFKSVDIPNNFVVSYSYDLPFGPGKGMLSHLAGLPGVLVSGWSVNGITTAHSGEPLAISVANSLLNTGTGNLADITCSHIRTIGNVGEWFDTGCFANPAPFTYGNSGVGHVRGPGLVNWDFSVGKVTNVFEKQTLEFRAELFNIFNQAHFANPATTLGNNDFGVINSTVGTPREVQLGLKYAF